RILVPLQPVGRVEAVEVVVLGVVQRLVFLIGLFGIGVDDHEADVALLGQQVGGFAVALDVGQFGLFPAHAVGRGGIGHPATAIPHAELTAGFVAMHSAVDINAVLLPRTV